MAELGSIENPLGYCALTVEYSGTLEVADQGKVVNSIQV